MATKLTPSHSNSKGRHIWSTVNIISNDYKSSNNDQQQYYTPTIKYPLVTTSFTDEIIDTQHKIIHPIVIFVMGYSLWWPKELRYGLHHHCSLKLQRYGLEQLLSKIAAIHKVVNQNEYEYLFANMIESYQIASGITAPIQENPYWKVDYVNSVWTARLIKELEEYSIHIKIENFFI